MIILIVSNSAAFLRSNGPNSWISGKAKLFDRSPVLRYVAYSGGKVPRRRKALF
jgi:hypothetical protein